MSSQIEIVTDSQGTEDKNKEKNDPGDNGSEVNKARRYRQVRLLTVACLHEWKCRKAFADTVYSSPLLTGYMLRCEQWVPCNPHPSTVGAVFRVFDDDKWKITYCQYGQYGCALCCLCRRNCTTKDWVEEDAYLLQVGYSVFLFNLQQNSRAGQSMQIWIFSCFTDAMQRAHFSYFSNISVSSTCWHGLLPHWPHQWHICTHPGSSSDFARDELI